MRALITGYCALKSNEGNMDFEISFDFIVFETERLLLREFNADDVDAVYAYAGDAENTIYMDWGPASREEVRNFVQSRLAQQITEPRRIFDFAVWRRAGLSAVWACFLAMTGSRRNSATRLTKHFGARDMPPKQRRECFNSAS